ncbi:hypothetical protein ACSNOI_29720 [Actinomadura kijaniata]|uniref:hypothetical protein n=1 Tax=Actinomadura kijaniata TaxID=46161 RepID=UPI003F1A3A66
MAELRAWLRGRLAAGGGERPAPHLLNTVLAGLSSGAVRVLLARALDEIVAAGALREREAETWADHARLSGQKGSQKETARRLGVTPRTARAWLGKGDAAIASHLASASHRPSPGRRPGPLVPSAAVPGGHDEVLLAADLAELEVRLLAEGAPPERLEAVRAFASDRLGGARRPRRRGADRSRRKREYDRVPERLGLIRARPTPDGRLAADGAGSILPVPYRLADTAEAAVHELHRAWSDRDRHALPLLADHAFRLSAPRLPECPELHLAVLETIANALRDAESLRGFAFARLWAEVATRVHGADDFRVWKARGVLIHLMQIHGYHRAALRAHRRHLAAFAGVRYTDEEDHSSHRMDRLARLVSLELDVGGPDCVERTGRAVALMRDIEEAGRAAPQSRHILARRMLERELARAVHHASGRRPVRSRRLERLAERLEGWLPGLAPDRALGSLDVLISVDIAYRDWPSLRRHGEMLGDAAYRGAAANLVHRVNHRLREARLLKGPEIPEADPAFDPLRVPGLLPRRVYVPMARP